MPWRNDMVPRRNDQAIWREDGDEVFICAPDGETMHTVSHVGADVWRACDGRRCVTEIVQLLLERYEVDENTANIDLQQYLDDLEQRQLIFRD